MEYTYFAEAVGSGRIKIGRSGNLPKRLKAIGTGCPYQIRLVAKVSTDELTESDAHAMFQDHRVGGEWFNFHDEIRAYLEDHHGRQEYLTVEQAAETLGVFASVVLSWIDSCELAAFNVSDAKHRPMWRIGHRDLRRFLESREKKRPSPKRRPFNVGKAFEFIK